MHCACLLETDIALASPTKQNRFCMMTHQSACRRSTIAHIRRMTRRNTFRTRPNSSAKTRRLRESAQTHKSRLHNVAPHEHDIDAIQ